MGHFFQLKKNQTQNANHISFKSLQSGEKE